MEGKIPRNEALFKQLNALLDAYDKQTDFVGGQRTVLVNLSRAFLKHISSPLGDKKAPSAYLYRGYRLVRIDSPPSTE